MKNNFKLLVTGSLAAILLIPGLAFSQSPDLNKMRHIRMTKIENGKKMEIDTVLTGNDVFVWNGDTINPENHMKGFSPSEFDKRHPEPVDRNKKLRRSTIQRGGALDDQLMLHGDSTEDIRIITEGGDTVGQKIIIHKRLRNGDEKDHFIYLHGGPGEQFPPVPGVPPVPHMKRFRAMRSSNSIDLNDPNVISFKKKDISGGREKIEIIRKKTTKSDNVEIDMDIDDALQVPVPPVPSIIHKEDQDMLNMERERKSSKSDKKK